MIFILLPGTDYSDHEDSFKENKLDLFEGDIMLTHEQRSSIFSAVATHSALEGGNWPQGIVPYVFSGWAFVEKTRNKASKREKVLKAMDDFHKHTCIKFIPRTREKHYINIGEHGRTACSSAVGRVANPEAYPAWKNRGQPVKLHPRKCMQHGT